MSDTPTIVIEDLSLRRSKGGTDYILSVPSFSARQGEFVAVTGESGSGKSTFLDLIGLVLAPDNAGRFSMAFPGTDVLDVRQIHNADARLSRLRRRHIGYVLQTGGLLPFLSVGENIHLPLVLQGRPDPGAVQALAVELGIADQLQKKPSQLSGGQRQRAAIARALIHEPDLVLADEPTAAVDRTNALEIMALLHALTARKRALVILVTHDTCMAETVPHRRVCFNLYRLQHGSKATLHQDTFQQGQAS